jgi:hypothetical protein
MALAKLGDLWQAIGHGKQGRTTTRSEETQKEEADSRGHPASPHALRPRSTADKTPRLQLTHFFHTKILEDANLVTLEDGQRLALSMVP